MNKYLSFCLVLIFTAGITTAVAFWQGMHSPMFAWVLNFMLMTAVLYFTQTFKPKLNSKYYNTKKWEANGKVYKWLGVNAFRKVLVWVGWEKLNKAANPVKNNLDALKKLEFNTRQSEFGHLIIFFIIVIFNIVVALQYSVKQSLWLFFLNIILNVYPIILQRYNRPRLQLIINKNL